MVRTALRACALAAGLLAGAALAQETQSRNIGERTVGEAHPFRLIARNQDCTQPLDFRFDFAPSPWLRATGDTVVRDVVQGESRPVPALIDLTNLPPGHYESQVDISCLNCRAFFLIANCRFDRQRLTLSVDAIAAHEPTPTVTAPAASPPPRRVERPSRVAEPPPRVATPEPANTSSEAAAPPAPAPTIAEAAPSAEPSEVVCAEQIAQWQWIAGGAAIVAALAGLAFATTALQARAAIQATQGPMAQSAMAKANLGARVREALSAGDGNDLMERVSAKALDRQTEGCEERLARLRDELGALIGAQMQAMRALSALALADARQGPVAAQADGWTKIAERARQALEGADAMDVRMLQAMEASNATLQGQQDAFGSTDLARQQWLQAQGFAPDDAKAYAVVKEVSSCLGHAGMSDMTMRLQRQYEECRRCAAELAILKALAETQ